MLRPPGRTMTQLRPLLRRYFSACRGGTQAHSQMMQLAARHAYRACRALAPQACCSAWGPSLHLSLSILSTSRRLAGSPDLKRDAQHNPPSPPLNLLLSTPSKFAGHPDLKRDAVHGLSYTHLELVAQHTPKGLQEQVVGVQPLPSGCAVCEQAAHQHEFLDACLLGCINQVLCSLQRSTGNSMSFWLCHSDARTAVNTTTSIFHCTH